MTTRKTDIVVTTIFEPTWLDGYLDNLERHGRTDDVTLRIICDRKTPPSVYAAAAAARGRGFLIDCPTLEDQAAYLKHVGLPDDFVPWNTDNRRNIGFLRAWENGADVLISIDDDNYCRADTDFVGEHLVVGQPAGSIAAHEQARGGRWYNICERLSGTFSDAIYPRGFPYRAREPSALAKADPGPASGMIAVNAGLWLDDPDVDAICRLAQRPRVTAANPVPVVLGPEVWTPVNTQNTALTRDGIPAYYYVRMGYPLHGMQIDRFGDILSGYFLQACAKHLGHAVRVGSPVADHRRTPHDLLKDLFHELAGIMIVEDLLPWLQELELEGSSYVSAYESLAAALTDGANGFRGTVWDSGGRDFLVETAQCMRQWLATVRMIHGR